MSLFLARLQQGTDVYEVTVVQEGFTLEPKGGQQPGYDDVVRSVLNHDGSEFAAFPTSNGVGGYDSVLIIPIV